MNIFTENRESIQTTQLSLWGRILMSEHGQALVELVTDGRTDAVVHLESEELASEILDFFVEIVAVLVAPVLMRIWALAMTGSLTKLLVLVVVDTPLLDEGKRASMQEFTDCILLFDGHDGFLLMRYEK